jgi:hypothetical protein
VLTCGDTSADDAFEHLADWPTGQTVIAMPALLHHRDQMGGEQFSKVPAGGLRRHTGRSRKLGCGQRPPAKQRAQDIGAGRIANQRRNFSDLGCTGHDRNM